MKTKTKLILMQLLEIEFHDCGNDEIREDIIQVCHELGLQKLKINLENCLK